MYSLIVLNSVLYSPAVKHKTTANDFVSQIRSVEGLEAIPAAYITSMFDDLQQHPLPAVGGIRYPRSEQQSPIQKLWCQVESQLQRWWPL